MKPFLGWFTDEYVVRVRDPDTETVFVTVINTRKYFSFFFFPILLTETWEQTNEEI